MERVAVLNTSWPATRGPDASVVAPSLTTTVPVGVGEPATVGWTVAVTATVAPNVAGLGAAVRVVRLPAMSSITPTELLPALTVTRSDTPSPLKSPAATKTGFMPEATGELDRGANDPSP